MPFTRRVTENGSCLFSVGSGVLKGEEILDAENDLLAAEGELRGITFELVDFTDVTTFEVTTDEIRQIVALNRRMAQLISHHVVVAVIAPSDLIYGFARMWQMLVESTGWTTAVVRSRAAADAWVKSTLETPCDTGNLAQ